MMQVTIDQVLQRAIADHKAGRFAEAENVYRQVLAQQPNHAHALLLLGLIASQAGQLDESIELIQRAIRVKPDYAEAHNNLGNALRDKGLGDEAIAAYRRALRLNPDHPDVHNNLGNALRDKGVLDEAIAACRQAIFLKPDFAEAHNNLGNALKDEARLDEAIACYRQACAIRPESSISHSGLVYALQFHPGYDAAEILRQHQMWDQRHAQALGCADRSWGNDRSPHRRLKIGYVSPDFRDHVVGRNLIPLLREHDHQAMEIFCYADVLREDAFTAKFRSYCDHWLAINRLSDEQLAHRIRLDGIDILVDLALHMKGNRLLTFARQPAPVQVTFAGYPGTTGLGAMGYRLTDPHLDPIGQGDQSYSEQSIRLADTFWCYEPEDNDPPVNPLPAASAGHITFGCLNNFCKVNDGVLELWSQVMRQVTGSRLLLRAGEGSHRQRTIETLGAGPQRVQFMNGFPHQQYLRQYHHIDVGLDTFPYNGHTTSLDSYWMGVPVVTLLGPTVVGRAGLSQLTNLGMAELVAQTPEQYVQIAVELAKNLDRLRDIRAGLRQRMAASPLMNAGKFARSIESAYRQMWQRWCRQVC